VSEPAERPGRASLALLAEGLARNIAAGARIAFFLRVSWLDLRATPGHFVTLVAFNLATWVAVSAARVGFQGELDPTALWLYLATVPLVLFAALTVATLYGRREITLLLAVGLIASDPVFALAGLALQRLPLGLGLGALLYGAFFVWLWLAALRAVAVCAGTRRPQFYQGALVVSGMLALLLVVFPSTDVWVQPPAGEAPPGLASERLFHLQGELIERRLAAIEPGRAGRPELFFVGYAPDGSQGVFGREMRFVKRLFDERFGTRGHSIALVNGETTLEEFPLATATNLGRALARVAGQMNPDEDALFLYVSAHGDESYRLAAEQRPLVLGGLTPTALARMLQDAGIKWKIVVVSACFSGGYIEPLRGADTLVITAAAANRHSFGCRTGNDFTYFGGALFRDALSRTHSFRDAFAIARGLIESQERSERLTPSLPQISVGAAIAARLGALEAAAR